MITLRDQLPDTSQTQATILFQGPWQSADQHLIRHTVSTITAFETASQHLLTIHTPLVCIIFEVENQHIFIAQCVSNPQRVITGRSCAELAHKIPKLWQPFEVYEPVE